MKYLSERQINKHFLLKDGDYQSTKEVFERIAKYIPNKPILAELDNDKKIIYHTSKDILNDIENLGDGLLTMGLENSHISICAENSYLYIIIDECVAGGIGVITPIDKDAPEDLLSLLLKKCESDVIFISSYLLDRIERIRKENDKLKTIITIDKKIEGYYYIKEIMDLGYTTSNKRYHNKSLDLNIPVKILFTSGTTGANKGVILSQNNLSANIINCMDLIRYENNYQNTSMSVLPMHHATEINTHIMARIASGRLTYINDNMKNMMNNIKIFKPGIITIVPMIANMFYKQIWLQARKAGKEDKLKKGIKLCKLFSRLGINIYHRLLKDVYTPFGGNLHQIICGGAVLNPEVVKGLRDLGIFIVNGYGITECGPLISMNVDTFKDIDSVGKPAPNLIAKVINVDEEGVGELCIKGKSVALGYYKDQITTDKVFYKDGFFNTGDLAKINSNGKIYLSGRKKNTIVLENGKNIYPEEIENLIQNNVPYCKDIVVYMGVFEGISGLQNVLTAGIFLDKECAIDNSKIKEDFKKINDSLPNYKKIEYINISKEEYEKTSTKKIIRNKVLEKHDAKHGIKI